MNAGAPVEMPWRELTPAVLWAWFPGQEGGAAIADALTGAVEPGGRLPTTFPKTAADAPVLSTQPVDGKIVYAEGSMFGYRGYEKADTTPAYPFGHGLGYTTWVYEDITAASDAAGDVELLVQGAQHRGAYRTRGGADLPGRARRDRPQRLVGFGSTLAAPNEIATVPITIPAPCAGPLGRGREALVRARRRAGSDRGAVGGRRAAAHAGGGSGI